jgi:hypothetical protein
MSDGPLYIRTEAETAAPVVAVPANTATYVDANGMPVGTAPATAVPMATAVPVATAPATVRTSYSRSFAPDAIVAAIVGLIVMLIGLIAITRAGFDGPMDKPVVDVLGFSHTTILGLIEIVIGGCLLISGATRSRSGALFFGSVLGIAAFVGAVQTKSFEKSLALESSFAWLLLFAAVIVVLTALLLPRFLKRSTVVR